MITKEILESHPVTVLKKELSKTNIKGYSKMKKSEVVALMLKPEHSQRFNHIVKKGEAPKPKKVIKIIRKKKEDIAEQQPKPPKKIIIKRTPKPTAPKPEKKIIIKRTPKPTAPKPKKVIKIIRKKKEEAPKPEKKIVIKKPRKETPGSIEAKRIKKKIAIKKGSTLKTKCEKADEQADKLYEFLKDLNEYDDIKGLASKKIQDQFPKYEKIYKEDIYPLIQYIEGRGDATECEKIMYNGYEENLRNIQSYWNRYKRTNELYNYKLEEEAKKKARREEKKKAKAPAPAKKEKKYDFNFMKKIKFSKNSSENNRATENAIRKNFTKIEIKKMCDVLYKNKNSKEFYKMTKNLEGESYEELVESNILEICEEKDFEEKRKAPAPAKKKIAIRKEISETPEGYQNPDRLIGGWLRTMRSQTSAENKKAAAIGIQKIKSGRYLSESKGLLTPNYTLQKHFGGSFEIISEMPKEFIKYLFDKDGNTINIKTTYKEKSKPAPAKKSTLDNINDKADKKIDAKIKRDEKSFLKMLDKILK